MGRVYRSSLGDTQGQKAREGDWTPPVLVGEEERGGPECERCY
jgi:hypothetical protein